MHKPLTDTHAHLTYIEDAEVLKTLDAVYTGTNALIIDPGVDYNDFFARYELLHTYSWVRLAAGIWPDEYPLMHQQESLEKLEQFLRHPACKLLGECGLDYYWMKAEPKIQQELFNGQLELALSYNKPVIVHSRDAWQDTLQCLNLIHNKVPVIIHCFSYGIEELETIIKNNYYVSFSGNITYTRMKQVLMNLENVPLELLLLETDTPYQNPLPYRGKPSTPFDIFRTYELVSRILRLTPETLHQQITNTIKQIIHEH